MASSEPTAKQCAGHAPDAATAPTSMGRRAVEGERGSSMPMLLQDLSAKAPPGVAMLAGLVARVARLDTALGPATRLERVLVQHMAHALRQLDHADRLESRLRARMARDATAAIVERHRADAQRALFNALRELRNRCPALGGRTAVDA